ncbi:hypothetical protein PQR71_35355 [Paraburkholderia fungorum]|uniref:helix-turn-helix transcriptional regulator n=1 Tax=Paraburkholderia fungorum TaxID=134537 RepID=UPI0038B9A9CF
MSTSNRAIPSTQVPLTDTVRQHCLERFELSVTEGARVLGVSRQVLTNLITGKAGISPEMAFTVRSRVRWRGGNLVAVAAAA